ncbi:TonB-linked outer membrane protein, SusC/RagA family [Chitinophaga sp. YR573]|uniref:SusC/RagA family TonB-linked outer membrane protein n=1 Tax=Chitinophaga sp. YR573 TaxID=1881040 RepID=UPI0008B83E99|nr:SusC/RagA family TonB-linked outer membrane protein [Chitinophaga sp. YR573]SEW08575.1 TonB-linked outer membrane protein, SusC/RagA family [Chitinophaga sp. YR573]
MKKGLLLWLFVAMSVLHTYAQTRTITGKVTDAKDGSALPGVSVVIKGTTKGTVTGIDGGYSIQATPENTLVFSFIGYTNQERPVGKNSNFAITLSTDNKQLSEVVVTALGITREKKSLGYSVQSVSGDALVKSGETNIIEGLASKAAGVQVIGSGGTPGASSKIIIRGNATFSMSNQPLIVIDGVPIDNETNATSQRNPVYNTGLSGVNNSNRALDINPDDIATVTILKGPSAAALYGAKAASGAIIYTTKRGRAGAVKVTYDFNAGFDKVSKLPDEQKIYGQGNIVGGVPVAQTGVANSWGPRISDIPTANKVYDNTKDFFQTGTTFTHNVAVTGGNEKNTFRLSLGRTDQKGIIPTTNLQRTNVRITVDSKVTDRLTVGATAQYSNTRGQKAQNGSNLSGPMLAMMRAPANYNLSDYKNEDGSSKNFAPYDNAYWSLYNNPFNDNIDRIIGNFNVGYKITNWLDATYRLGVDQYSDSRKQVFAIGSLSVDDQLGQIEEYTIKNLDYYSDFILGAHKDFNDKISARLNLGGNVRQNETSTLYSRGNQLTIPNYYNLNNAAVLYTDASTGLDRSSALFYDATVSYNNIVFLTTTGRNEWSSTFGRAKNNFFFPSVSAAFVFTEVLPQNDILSYGKLRVAVAGGGKSPSRYATQTTYAVPTFADGSTDGNSFPFLGKNGFTYSNTLGNNGLKPERSTEKEIGLDLKFLKNRINVEFTYYDKLSKDILVNTPLAGSSGFQAILANAGEMSNKGIEILASADVIRSKGFGWNIELNFSHNKNKVLKLATGVSEIDVESAFTSIGSYAIVGQPYGAFYGTKWERDPSSGKIVVGTNGIPVLAASRGNIGNPFPDWTGGIRNTFTYKGFTLGALLDVRHGGQVWGGTYARLTSIGKTAMTADRERTYVIDGVVLGTDGKYTANTTAVNAKTYFQNMYGDQGAGSATENAVYSGSWVRLREASLSYRYNMKNTKIFNFAELSFTGRNLWLHTDYPGVDPETSLTGAGSNLTGFDYFNNPGTKTYAIGVKLGF